MFLFDFFNSFMCPSTFILYFSRVLCVSNGHRPCPLKILIHHDSFVKSIRSHLVIPFDLSSCHGFNDGKGVAVTTMEWLALAIGMRFCEIRGMGFNVAGDDLSCSTEECECVMHSGANYAYWRMCDGASLFDQRIWMNWWARASWVEFLCASEKRKNGEKKKGKEEEPARLKTRKGGLGKN